jgi:putative ABC transport system ATP-binding protein
VISIFQQLNNQGITIILVTHEHDLARYAKRIVRIQDGLILQDYLVKNRRDAVEDLAAADHALHMAEQANP